MSETAKPIRLQRLRTKGFKIASPNGLPIVCITRSGRFRNPFSEEWQQENGFNYSPSSSVAMFESWLNGFGYHDVAPLRQEPCLRFTAGQALLRRCFTEGREQMTTKTKTIRRIANFSEVPGDVPNVVVEPYPGRWIAWWTNNTAESVLEFSRKQYRPRDCIKCPYGEVGDAIEPHGKISGVKVQRRGDKWYWAISIELK